ncbi:glucose 1-dehydrogenase [Phaeacidiphilus oryzae]|uniref:glucose 1-dehydrogenase n=1 Tax=Phaeacidiphilus oryzae TaxID=348818 RepID=UPI00055A1C79|nr:glucose 1-dehydrogenase [Phaeacidiphilus oryzae]
MRALTVVPGKPGSLHCEELPAPETPPPGELLVRGLALGVCGTDREIAGGDYGWAPSGRDRLVIGHESLGRVEAAPAGGGFSPGDLVCGVVRRPDPEPCPACARGEFDMCRNGRYSERGIKELDGYGSSYWTVPAEYAVRLPEELADGLLGVLAEPASVVAKAWEQVDRIGARSVFEPRRALVVGAGPIGLLAALLGVRRGLEVHVLDLATDGPKPRLVRELGAVYHTGPLAEVGDRLRPDVVVEATGVGELVFTAMSVTADYGIVCLTGVSPSGRPLPLDAGGLNREIVLANDVVVGSVNANQRHYEAAVEALAEADREWLAGLITRRLPAERCAEAFAKRPDDIKTVIEL